MDSPPQHDYITVINNTEAASCSNDDGSDLPHFTLPSTFFETYHSRFKKLPAHYRWVILLGFSLLSFSSACLWITFAPCLYIFTEYYSQSPSYINFLSTIYMFTYIILLLPSLKFFDIYGLRFGVIFGAFLNALGAFIRFLGSLSKSGFWILFIGQSISASAQVFMLGIPPKLANVWFLEFGEQNFATSIGVTANNAGVAAGFILSPWMIKEKTAEYDVPKYLLLQFGFCILVYLFLMFTFRSAPRLIQSRTIKPVKHKDSRTPSSTAVSFSNINHYMTDKSFMLLTISYGMITGGQYALSTLLAQMILPVFKEYDEAGVGFLGFLIVISGMIGSLMIGVYLDNTYAYKKTCHVLYIGAIISLGIFNFSLKREISSLMFISSILFGVFSFAISPAVLQYATIITSKRFLDDEIATTGILNTLSQIWGIFLISFMGSIENLDSKYTMEKPNWVLFSIVLFGLILLLLIPADGDLGSKVNLLYGEDDYIEEIMDEEES
ncbi:4112_t:CDS:2 [Acaulospora morrowiae]|uniref:4112_t:CDS:1 n=1 Tax=Acaulospora morrowiae TaxID=94023 RepID=A0A9N8VYT9_9GLOM|nr:4112_t:CDS:2 [Acaulospora morrowiae]